MKQYDVSMTMTVEFTVAVEAENEEQAEKIAMDKADNNEAYYLKNYNSVWSREVNEVMESEPEPEPETGKNHFHKAVEYIRQNMDVDDMAILQAKMNQCYKAHLVPSEDAMDCDNVIELLEEYGLENDLEECWWEDEFDISDFLTEL